MLLAIVCYAKSFEELRIIDDIEYATFLEAGLAL